MHQDDPGQVLDEKSPGMLQVIREKILSRDKLFLIIAGSFLLLAVVGGVYGAVVLSNSRAPGQVASELSASGSAIGDGDIADMAEILPQQKRSNEENDSNTWSSFSPMVDPFSDPMKLTGIVIGGRGGAMAIIESSGTSYIVSEGDYVDDLWAVRQVSREMVILRAHNQEVILYLDQPPVTRTLDYDTESEDGAVEEGA